jgi:hypothetical protein
MAWHADLPVVGNLPVQCIICMHARLVRPTLMLPCRRLDTLSLYLPKATGKLHAVQCIPAQIIWAMMAT